MFSFLFFRLVPKVYVRQLPKTSLLKSRRRRSHLRLLFPRREKAFSLYTLKNCQHVSSHLWGHNWPNFRLRNEVDCLRLNHLLCIGPEVVYLSLKKKDHGCRCEHLTGSQNNSQEQGNKSWATTQISGPYNTYESIKAMLSTNFLFFFLCFPFFLTLSSLYSLTKMNTRPKNYTVQYGSQWPLAVDHLRGI